MSIVLAVSLLLAGGASAYALLGASSPQAPEDLTLRAISPWSTNWLNGAEQAWTYDAPGNGERTEVWPAGDKLVRIVVQSDSTVITVLRQTGDGVEAVWEQTLDHALSSIGVWKNWVIDRDQLIDIDTQERVRAPWSADAVVSVSPSAAVACEGHDCALWTSRYDERWKTTIDSTNTDLRVRLGFSSGGRYAAVTSGIKPGNGASDGELLALDLDDGSAQSMGSITSDDTWVNLSDGWLVTSTDKSSGSTRITLYSSDGSSLGDISQSLSKSYATFPYSPTQMSVAQARAWIENADTSWAPSTMSISLTGADCLNKLEHGGSTLSLADVNSVVRKAGSKSDKDCTPATINYIGLSGFGPLAEVREVRDHNLYLRLVDPGSSGESGAILIGDIDSWRYFHDGDLLIGYDNTGKLTAYRPKPAA